MTDPLNPPTATYVGGPLDGQTTHRRGARWSTYRGDDGRHLPTPSGDRTFCGAQPLDARRVARGGYSKQRDQGRTVYVHATAINGWRADKHARREARR